jgi:hypothetical protein
MAADFLSGESLYRDVVTYSQFGEHRTATDGENKTTDWIVERLEAAGLQTSFQSFPVETHFVGETSLIMDGQQVDCFPLWPPCWTGPRPVRAPLAPLGATADQQQGRIALLKPSPSFGALPFLSSEDDATLFRTAVEAGALAVIVISSGPSGEIHAFNTPTGTDVCPVPSIQVPARYEPALVTAVEHGTEVSLLSNGRTEPQAEARNVFGRLYQGKSLIVISTPKSGWFTCAGERGPGVALFLALARWVSQRKSHISYLFDGNTCHEIGGLGVRRFVEELAPSPDQVLAWIHLGANIATWEWEESPTGLQKYARPENYRIVCDSPDLLPLLKNAFAHLPGLQPVVGRGIGEMRLMIQTGYHGFGFNGGAYRFFHTPVDVPEQATAPELLEPVALALTRALESIEALGK